MALLFDIADALGSLHPGANWFIDGDATDYNNLVWEDESIPQPSEDAINLERQRLTDEWNAKEYQRNRETAYPKIQDQLDMLWHAIDSNETLKTDFADFYNALKAVKDQYPGE